MRPAWTAEAVSLLHLHSIKQDDVAERMGVSKQYLSQLLTGAKTPPGGRDRVMKAIHTLIIDKVAQEQSVKTDYEQRSE